MNTEKVDSISSVKRPTLFPRLLKVLLGLMILIVLIVVGVGVWGWQSLYVPIKGSDTSATFKVVSGEKSKAITDQLQQGGFIRSSLWLLGYLKLSNNSFLPGIYTLNKTGTSIENVQPVLTGTVAERQVTIREGLRLNEIAQLLQSDGVISAQAFLDASRYNSATSPIPASYDLKSDTFMEGFLFPDTYRFAADATAQDIVNTMESNYVTRTQNLNVSYNTLILASIIEREAKFDEDRPIIASVFLNRLAKGMALQSDVTVQYAKANTQCGMKSLFVCTMTNWWPALVSGDTKSIDSPHNTYENTGLPKTPISNPGLKSIQAAVNPAQTDYLFFVADSTGHAHFAKTLAEHNANIAKYMGK